MQSIELSDNLKNPISIELSKIVYPNDAYAIFEGKQFSNCSILDSVHYRTCKQIEQNVAIPELLYYQWTLEKISKFGSKFTKLLLSEGKGCGVSQEDLVNVPATESNQSVNQVYANIATQKFVDLYNSISNHWDPKLGKYNIVFFKLLSGKYTIFEGRHRICILLYKLQSSGVSNFIIDSAQIRKDYYYLKFKSKISLFKKLLTRNS